MKSKWTKPPEPLFGTCFSSDDDEKDTEKSTKVFAREVTVCESSPEVTPPPSPSILGNSQLVNEVMHRTREQIDRLFHQESSTQLPAPTEVSARFTSDRNSDFDDRKVTIRVHLLNPEPSNLITKPIKFIVRMVCSFLLVLPASLILPVERHVREADRSVLCRYSDSP